jgi:parvulin-like peptidyl-prolyl isomerase
MECSICWLKSFGLVSLAYASGWCTLTAVAQNAEPMQPQVVAKVDDEPITAAEVQREFDRAYGKQKLTDEQRQAELLRARDQVIDRRLVLRRLVRTGKAASAADIDQAFGRLMKQLADQNIKPAEHYERLGTSEAEVRQQLLWTLSWQKYLAETLTDESVARYFERNRREFDGTQLRVSHILLQAPGEKAAEIRLAVVEGKLTFADAAKQHSRGPSAKAGGDIGWIERHQPMPEPFSKAAFALEVGEVSPPVTTPLGVHLIQVTEVKPGERTWQEAREELRAAMTIHAFRWLADKERPEAKIQRVDDWP